MKALLSYLDPQRRDASFAVEHLVDWYRKNWDNYEALSKMQNFPLLGIPAQYRRGELEAEENTRYWSDYSKNTGIDLDRMQYPIRSGRYANYSYLGNTFNQAVQAGMKLYRPVKMPKKKQITVNRYRYDYSNRHYYGDRHFYFPK